VALDLTAVVIWGLDANLSAVPRRASSSIYFLERGAAAFPPFPP